MELIDHPDHYAKGRKFEAIDVIEDWELGFCLGNALKYISRAGRKGDYLNDLQKAKWYIEREIENYTPKSSSEQKTLTTFEHKKRKPTHKRMVYCLETGRLFSSIEEAHQVMGIDGSSISKSAKYGRKARGYHFKYY